ncbi:MAG: CPBP family intramembrane glutamic endopeptidase [Christensenellales bacterium]|jgi:membrane protease YdiL (CAAX protease family)
MNIKNDIISLWKESDKNAVKGILFMTVILAVYFYFGIQDFFTKSFPDTSNLDYWKYIYHNFTPVILFFGLGILFVKFIIKADLKDYGLGLGDTSTGLKICLILTPLMIFAGLTAVWDEGMNTTYPLSRYVINAPAKFILLYYVSYIAYYVGWEFLFRGIGIFSFNKGNALMAIAVSTMISALVHSSIAGFGKPLAETFSAIPAGILFGYVAYKTRSIWYGFYLHALVGFSTDFLIAAFIRNALI